MVKPPSTCLNIVQENFQATQENVIANKLLWFENGLTFVKCCIIAHDGNMEIKNKLGKGMKICLTIPKERILQ